VSLSVSDYKMVSAKATTYTGLTGLCLLFYFYYVMTGQSLILQHVQALFSSCVLTVNLNRPLLSKDFSVR